ncbi:MAG: hypothetical protein JNK15_10225 [Planctomycetes bacterium]|nr:hypothetical protein [Planctomycetota bacterium]
MNPLTLFAVANAMGGDFMTPLPSLPGWNRGIRAADRQAERAKRQPVDVIAELRKLDGKRFRHVVTGEERWVYAASLSDRVGSERMRPTRRGCYYVNCEPRKALRWLRNAVEVRA